MITIKIKTGNSAFDDNGREIARILRELATDFEYDNKPKTIIDINGNKVGTVTYKW